MQARSRWGTALILGAIVTSMALHLEHTPVPLSMLEQTSARPVPIVVVVFDELPVASLMDGLGRIDASTFPNFGRLARRSTWYRNATTTGVTTSEALPALLTGSRSSAASRRQNLFTMLGGAYDIKVTERLSEYCPRSSCTPPARKTAGSWAEDLAFFPRGGRGQGFVSFIEQIRGGNEPTLYFLHSVMPHSPWRFLPSGQIYPEPEPEPGEIDVPGPGRRWSQDEWLTTQVYQRHLLQLKLVDRLVGVLLDRLQTEGMFREALLVVTADHGIGFVPGEHKRLISKRNIGGIAGIPLFIKRPMKVAGEISDAPVQITDVLPTVADILDLSNVGADAEGSSVLGTSPHETRTIGGMTLTPSGLEKYAAIAWKESLFKRDPSGALNPFMTGPRDTAKFVGTAVPEVETLVGPVVHLSDADGYTSAKPTDDVFPALLSGELKGAPAERSVLAIAVDGRIVAMTRTYPEDGRAFFYTMVSPRFFRPGPNSLTTLLLGEDGRFYRLNQG